MSDVDGRPAELSVREGYLPPLGLPDGQVILTRLDDGPLRIEQADPRALVSAELLIEAFAPWPGIGVSLSLPPERAMHPGQGGYWTGAVLKIEGVNRTVIYRIGEYLAPVNGYVMEWPD